MAPQKLEHTYTLFGSAPWGFRLSGGREFNQALVICRVTPGSVASRCGLEAGDIIKAVEGQFCNAMTQEMCQELVKSARGSLNITVEKPRNLNSNPDPTVYNDMDIKERLEQFNRSAKPFPGSPTSPSAPTEAPKITTTPTSPADGKPAGFRSVSFTPRKRS